MSFTFKSSTIDPLPKVSNNDIENFHINDRVWQKNNHKTSTQSIPPSKHARHFDLLAQYLSRIPAKIITFPPRTNPIIISNILLNQNCIGLAKFENMPIWGSNNSFYISVNNIYAALQKHIVSANDISTYSLLAYFPEIKKLQWFVQNHFHHLSPEKRIDLLRIFLYPSGDILNPLAFDTITGNYALDETNQIRFNHTLDFSVDLKTELQKTKDISKLPLCYINDFKKIYHDDLQHILFNTTTLDFVNAISPNVTTDQKNQILAELAFIEPIKVIVGNNPLIAKNLATFIIKHPKLSLFQILPPTNDEFLSICYIHQNFNSFPNSPKVSSAPVDCIRYAAISKLAENLDLTQKLIAQSPDKIHENYEKMISPLMNQLSLNINSRCPLEAYLYNCMNYNKKDFSTSSAPFSKLRNTLFAIFNGKISTINDFSKLITKVYLGNKFVKKNLSTKNFSTHSVTVISCTNKQYMFDFLSSIFSYPLHNASKITLTSTYPIFLTKNFSTYTLADLVKQNNIDEFILDNYINTKIVNIDTTHPTTSIDLSFFEKMITPTKGISTNSLTKEKFSSDIHYIFITDNALKTNQILTNIPHDTIIAEGTLETIRFEPLSCHEYLFLTLGFIYYNLDSSLPTQKSPSTYTETSTLSENELIDFFISNFCNDTTASIPADELAKFPADILDLKNISDLKKKAHSIGIDKLPFCIVDDLYYYFTEWQKYTFPSSPIISESNFKNILRKKYHPLFYIRKAATRLIPLSPKKEYRGYYGLTIDIEKHTADKSHKKIDQQQHNNIDDQQKFTNYLETLISKYLDIF